MNESKTFEYNYSAERARIVESIIKKYSDDTTDKLEQLKALDKKAQKRGTSIAFFLGISGTLVLGSGMSMAMVGSSAFFVPGIILGLIGVAALSSAYPVYKKIIKADREKYADQILQLAKQIQ